MFPAAVNESEGTDLKSAIDPDPDSDADADADADADGDRRGAIVSKNIILPLGEVFLCVDAVVFVGINDVNDDFELETEE